LLPRELGNGPEGNVAGSDRDRVERLQLFIDRGHTLWIGEVCQDVACLSSNPDDLMVSI
jgi:hypothetical protein